MKGTKVLLVNLVHFFSYRVIAVLFQEVDFLRITNFNLPFAVVVFFTYSQSRVKLLILV